MTPTLETSRLLLQPLTLADAARTQAIFPHWEIVRHLNASVPWPYPANGALAFYRDVTLPAVDRGEEWAWTLRLRAAPGEPIGAISLFTGEEDNRGFWLGLPWHRQGLMTEAVIAVTDFWFEALKMPVLQSPKASANQGSRRISARTGMRLVKEFEKEFVSGRQLAELWEITREEWSRARPVSV